MLKKMWYKLARRYYRQLSISIASTIDNKEVLTIIKVLFKDELYKLGEITRIFEDKFKKYLGCKYSIAFPKARVGIYSILKSLKIGKGDEVIIAGYTCVVVPNAVIYANAKPIYVDIDNNYNINLNDLKNKINKKTRAIIVQHLFGNFDDNIQKIKEITKRKNIVIIEDACQALGTEYKGKKAGNFGDVAFFSLDYSKIITTGQGGILVTDNTKLYESIKKFMDENFHQPKIKGIRRLLINLIRFAICLKPSLCIIGEPLIYGTNIIDRALNLHIFTRSMYLSEINSNKMPNDYLTYFTDIQSMIGLSQLSKIGELNEKRISIAKYYNRALRELEIRTLSVPNHVKCVYLQYPILCKDRDKVIDLFSKNQVDLGDWFNSVIYPVDKKQLRNFQYTIGQCTNAEHISNRVINLPNNVHLNEIDLDRVVKLLKVCKENSWI